jgi:hypothetical protein
MEQLKMKVFLSWSGERSKKAAEAFHEWLPDVLQNVVPWMSSEDIDSGVAWNHEIRTALNESNFGLIFVTRDNLKSEWLMFESGALAKHVADARAVPLIVDAELTPIMLPGPLVQLQARNVSQQSILRLVREMNYFSNHGMTEERLSRCFSSQWQRLEDKLKTLPEPKGEVPSLDQDTMLKKILEVVQASQSREASRPSIPKEVRIVGSKLGRFPASEQALLNLNSVIEFAGFTQHDVKQVRAALEKSRLIGDYVHVFTSKGEFNVFPGGEILRIPNVFTDINDSESDSQTGENDENRGGMF